MYKHTCTCDFGLRVQSFRLLGLKLLALGLGARASCLSFEVLGPGYCRARWFCKVAALPLLPCSWSKIKLRPSAVPPSYA